jgi:hypothetical protein
MIFFSDLDGHDTIYYQRIGLKYNLLLPIYSQWKEEFDAEDHQQCDLIEFIKQLKDEEMLIYFTDAICEEASQWEDEHGEGIVNLIRYSITERLNNKQQYPLTPFDTTH